MREYRIECDPPNRSYLDAIRPRRENGYVFWFDDSGRERAAKAVDFVIKPDGTWCFRNTDRAETIRFVPKNAILESRFWVDPDKLANICRPPAAGKAFFRPFIAKDPPETAGVFLVGVNPASAIYPEEGIDAASYAEMLFVYKRFEEYYSSSRVAKGKRVVSPTRKAIDDFSAWLKATTGLAVLETNVVGYPTGDYKELVTQGEDIIESGQDIFRALLMGIRPKYIVLHGRHAVKHFRTVVETSGIAILEGSLRGGLAELEQRMPVAIVQYFDGCTAEVFACQHLCKAQSNPARHHAFRAGLEAYLTS